MGNSLTLLNSILEDYGKEFANQNEDDIFEYFVAENYFKERDLALDEVKTGLIGGKHDWGIDGLYLYVNDVLINDIEELEIESKMVFDIFIFQFKNKNTIDEDTIKNFNSIAPHIVNLDSSLTEEQIHPDVNEKINLFKEIIKKIASKFPQINFNFIHATKGDSKRIYGPLNINEPYKRRVEDLEGIIKTATLGGNVGFNYEILDAEQLIELTRKKKSYASQLKVKQNPLFVEYGDSGQKGYMATVKLRDYYNFLVDENNKLKRYLFEANIRDFQNKTTVNKDIMDTISNTTDIDFWWLNNGVTIIADQGSLTGNDFYLENIQIVNGLQTSHAIYHVYTSKHELKEIDERSLFVKVIITDEKESRDKIIKATNSQNPVNPSLLRATDKRQRDIEDYFYRNNYYYDRRKHFYKNQGKPRSHIISINELSQSVMSILFDNPSKARSNPTILIKKDEDYKKLFRESRDVHVYFNCMLIAKQTEDYLKKHFEKNDDIDEAISKYFTLHLSRVVSSVYLQEVKINEKNLKNIGVVDIEEACFDTAIHILKEIIVKYKEEKNKEDLVNVSKLGGFSTYLVDELKGYL